MKKVFVLFSLFACLFLTACTPSGFSNEAADKITKNHKADAEEWFAKNMPEAKVDSGRSLADSSDLFMAICGRYSKGSAQYRYIYDYDADIMYLEEYCDEVSTIIKGEVSKLYGVKEENIEIGYYSHYIELTCANDEANPQYGHAEYGDKCAVNYVLYPYGSNPALIAEDALHGDNPQTEFTAKAYVDTIPDYDPKVIGSLTGFAYISFCTPMDLEYEGVNYAVYYQNMAFATFTHLEKVDDKLYLGYEYEEKITVNDDGSFDDFNKIKELQGKEVLYSPDTSKEFEVCIPIDTSIIIVAAKGNFYDCFINGSGENTQTKFKKAESVKAEHFEGYSRLGAYYFVPETKLKVYYLAWDRKPGNGRYTIKRK